MDFPLDPSGPPLYSAEEEVVSNTKLHTDFKKTIHQHKWMVSYLTFSDKLYKLLSNFTSREERLERNESYRAEVGLISAVCRIETNCGTQYILGEGVVPGKPEYQNSYREELGSQFGVMCAIKIMESITGITTLVVNSCDNISSLRRATIHPEAVKSIWKQVDLISRLSDVYQSM